MSILELDFLFAGFTSVRKTVDATEAQFEQLAATSKKMSTEVAAGTDEINEVMASGGQLGVATEHLSDFTRVMIDLGNSCEDLNAGDAATTIAQFANMLSILASFAQAESLSVSENCKWRIRKDFAEGKTMNLVLLYGYRSVNGKIEIVPEEAEVVRRVFAAYLSGIGTPTIASMLRREHAPTRMGGDWYDKGVMEIQSPLRCTENAAHCHFRKAETDQREIVGQAVPKEKAGSVRERTEKCGAADLLRRTAFHSDSGADHGIPRQAGVRV